ncbi:MFS transporter [Bradyrhizobium sp. LHD-71]|uniref:MFS transporter n=1 Tax=Bradyrhizobium sp. LHD-71 TaxID=3072141 RepID=UPI00280C4825|nr:MFS transporter [Bradyrhizobium sp. LHD-71]MDQ8727301.1 MFS transporter [Bradyrhizobium sp. LHD-71]
MKLSYGWVVVGVGALMTCIGMGAMMSLAVFLQPIAESTGWSRGGVSATATLNFLCMGVAGFLWGAVSDRFGTRIVVLAGAVLLGIGLVGASQATSLWQFQLVYGVLVGTAAGSFYAPMVAAASGWIQTHRSLAVALVSAGMGVAPLTVAQFASWLNLAYDWRSAMLIIGICASAILMPAALLVRRPRTNIAPGAAAGMVSVAPSEVPMTATQALRTPQFITLALAHFACCACHSGPIFHMVTYAMVCGIAPMAAVSIYGVAGLSGLGGRLAFGALADRIGAKPVLVGGLLLQALAAAAYLAVGQLGEFYALSVIFGLAYGGVMPLYAILVREYFGEKIMGTMFGAVSMTASLGMALGPWAGGMVFDAFNSYLWLYVGSFSIGLAAVAVALAFPTTVHKSPQPVMA